MDNSPDLGHVLASNYLLATLNVRTWSARKTDKNATTELLADKGAVSNAASVVKSLLAGNDSKLKETQSAYTRIRTFFYERSSPWTTSTVGAMKGDRLVATAASIDFLSTFSKLKKDAEEILEEFLDEYDDAVQRSAATLGALYDPTQYPDKQQLRDLFSADMHLRPLPESADFDKLSNVPAELATGLKRLYERGVEQQMENALSDVQRRLLSELERMDTQLSKVAGGEKTRLFKSMVSNLKSLNGMARDLNFINNPEIAAIADAIDEHLLQHEVDAYRDNAALAGNVADSARRIAETVKDDDVWTVTPSEVETTVEPAAPPSVESAESTTSTSTSVTSQVPEINDDDFMYG